MFSSSPANRPSTGTLASGRAVERPALPVALERAVEADDAGQPGVALGGLHERLRAAEAEADRDRALAPASSAASAASTSSATCSGVRLLDVRPELEVLVARAEAGRAAEVVDRDRRVAGRREALRELLVEAEQAAHVGQDDDAGRRPPRGRGRRRTRCRRPDVSVRRSPAAPPAITVKPGGSRGRSRRRESTWAGNVPLPRENRHRQHRRRGARASRPSSCGTTHALGVVDRRASRALQKLDDEWPLEGARRVWDVAAGRPRAGLGDGDGLRAGRRPDARRSRTRGYAARSACASSPTACARGSRSRSTSRPRSRVAAGAALVAAAPASATSLRALAAPLLLRAGRRTGTLGSPAMFVFKAAVVGAGARAARSPRRSRPPASPSCSRTRQESSTRGSRRPAR